MELLSLKNISLLYDKRKISGVHNISFSIAESEVVSLLGPSGAGKSTTLKIITEELKANSGEIYKASNLKIGYISQDSKLIEERTVYQNLLPFVSFIDGEEKQENQIRTALQTLGLTNEIHNPVKNISGGQKQRVMVARAIVTNPNLIIMDEPFEHLDQNLRSELIEDLFYIFRDKKISILWVTHEAKEALSFSDKILMMNFGKIYQEGTPEEVYFTPKNLFVARFFTDTNCFVMELIEEKEKTLLVKFRNKELTLLKPEDFKRGATNDLLVIIRPENAVLKDKGDALFSGKVISKKFTGAKYELRLKSEDFDVFNITVSNTIKIKLGDYLYFDLDYEHLHVLGEV